MPRLDDHARRAIAAERYLQDCYRKMAKSSNNRRVSAVIHDLLLMEEMNEVLLKSLSQGIES